MEDDEQPSGDDLEAVTDTYCEEKKTVGTAETTELDADPRIAVLTASEVLDAVEEMARQAVEVQI